MPSPQHTAVVIGAGIVGLHVAQALRKKGYEVFLLERDATLGEQSSGRNSGVIHAGIFYSSGSLKEKTCIEGNRLTYEWLEHLKVPHRRTGKWVVPEADQHDELEPFFAHLQGLPIPHPRLLSEQECSEAEPKLRCLPAIDVPSTGIVDAAAYVNALALYVEHEGSQILRECEITGVKGQTVQTSRGDMAFDLAVNCAGLFSDQIAAMAGLEGYEIRPCRGDYYIMTQCPLSRPVYHLPYRGAPGLGLHLTPTLDEQMLIGPNAFFIEEKLDYRHQSEPDNFKATLQYFLPDWKPSSIKAAYSGNRPKLFYQGNAVNDFTLIQEGAWIHLMGIDSPGLTAAPALALEALALI